MCVCVFFREDGIVFFSHGFLDFLRMKLRVVIYLMFLVGF